jgi:hypothetical protein
MRRVLLTAIATVALSLAVASQAVATSAVTGAFSAFGGKVSCHFVRGGGVTTVRCWTLSQPGTNAAVSTGDTSGRLAHTHWTPPVGNAMIFNHKYGLGNGVSCAYRYRRPTDTTIIKSVICSTSNGGPLLFASPSGLAVNLAP